MPRVIGCTAVHLRELPRLLDPIEAFESLRGDPYPWLLDSATRGATGDVRRDRYSFAGTDPYLVLRAFSRRIELEGRREVRPGLALGREVSRRIESFVYERESATPPGETASGGGAA